MGILHRFDADRDIVLIVWDGRITPQELFEHIQALTSDPKWSAVSRFLADVRTVTDSSAIGKQEMAVAIDMLSANHSALAGKRNAVVANSEFRKASLYAEQIERHGTDSVVFNSLDTACIYLNLEAEQTWHSIGDMRAELLLQKKRNTDPIHS